MQTFINELLRLLDGQVITIFIAIISGATAIYINNYKINRELTRLFNYSKLSDFIRRHNSYLPHKFFELRENDKKVSYSYNDLKREMKARKVGHQVWFILGEAGHGKSLLSEKLTSICVRKYKIYTKKTMERGVIYFKMSDYDSIDSLLFHISERSNSKQDNMILTLDGFDEFRGFRNKESNEILEDLFSGIREKYRSFDKIIITSRVELFKNASEVLSNQKIRTSDGGDYPRLFYIRSFSNRQSYNLYKKIGGSGNSHIPNEIIHRGKYKRRMREYLAQSKEDSIFSMPFLVNYADLLFKNVPTNELLRVDKIKIFKLIINFYLEREFNKYDQNFIDRDKNDNRKNLFKESIIDLINKIVNYMIINNTYSISYEELIKIIDDRNISIDKNTLISRNFMIQNINGEYKFIHLSFFEYFVANTIFNYDYEVRKRYLCIHESTNLRKMYIEFLYNYKKEVLDKVINCINCFVQDIFVGKDSSISRDKSLTGITKGLLSIAIHLNDDIDIKIEEIIKLMPFIQLIKYKELYLKNFEFDSFISFGHLDFAYKKIRILHGLENWGHISSLDLRNNRLKSIEILKNIKTLNHLYINNIPPADIIWLLEKNDAFFDIDVDYILSIYEKGDRTEVFQAIYNNLLVKKEFGLKLLIAGLGLATNLLYDYQFQAAMSILSEIYNFLKEYNFSDIDKQLIDVDSLSIAIESQFGYALTALGHISEGYIHLKNVCDASKNTEFINRNALICNCYLVKNMILSKQYDLAFITLAYVHEQATRLLSKDDKLLQVLKDLISQLDKNYAQTKNAEEGWRFQY